MKKWPNFTEKEFLCKCGCGLRVQTELIDKLQEARTIAGVPFRINSGARCPMHNKNIGASDTSSHTLGLAADIAVRNGNEYFSVLEGLIKAGFARIGRGKDDRFLHADIDKDKPQRVSWSY